MHLSKISIQYVIKNSTNKKCNFKICAAFLLMICFCLQNVYSYNSKLDFEYKGGSRHIGRVNALIPLIETEDQTQMLYFDTIGTAGGTSTQEVNVGLGYRQIFKVQTMSFIAGTYCFYDWQSTKNNNNAQELVAGFELLTKTFEFIELMDIYH